MVKLKRGDRTAFDQVFALAWPAVQHFARRWLGDNAEVDDVAQRALVKIFEQASAFDDARDALTWVLEVTVWECRTERTRRRRAQQAPRVDAPSPAAPEAEVEHAELLATLAQVMRELPESDRAELARVLADEASGDAAARKRRQRAVTRLTDIWRRLHGN
jgi:RNA polymerase sigma-70 factor, ECF subfamily